MPRKTSFYLSDEDDALLRAEMARGVTLKEIMRRGLGATDPDVELARLAASEALEAVGDELQDRIERAVERALRRMQGG